MRRATKVLLAVGGGIAMGTGSAYAWRRISDARRQNEIPSTAVPPPQPPPGRLGDGALATDIGLVDLTVLPDPKIVAMKAGDRVWLNLPMTASRFRPIRGEYRPDLRYGSIEAPGWRSAGETDGSFSETVVSGQTHLLATGWAYPLYNIGGPGANKLYRHVRASKQYAGPDQMYISPKPGWGPGDWAQIRRYPATLYVVEFSSGMWQVERVEVRLDLEPMSIWIMGA